MKKLLCESCQHQMYAICQIEATNGTYDSNRNLITFPVEDHQCQNDKCKDYAKVKHYEIRGNAAVLVKPGTYKNIKDVKK